jgi:hypothetical protein
MPDSRGIHSLDPTITVGNGRRDLGARGPPLSRKTSDGHRRRRMMKRAFGPLVLAMILATGLAWALSDADSGALWAQASSKQKIGVANIISRDLGGDPWKYVQCLDKFFADPAKANVTIRDAAKECKAQQ